MILNDFDIFMKFQSFQQALLQEQKAFFTVTTVQKLSMGMNEKRQAFGLCLLFSSAGSAAATQFGFGEMQGIFNISRITYLS